MKIGTDRNVCPTFMCCRYLLLRDTLRDLLAQLGVSDEEGDVAYFADKYNIAPCAKIPVVRTRTRAPVRKRECVSLLWNFTPSRMTRSAGPLFNARAESLWEKPAFREAARLRRCLIPASGFYEWARAGRARLPWLFQLRDAEPFFMAGIWEADTCAIITTEPNALMQPIHNRMPAMIRAADASAWLDSEERARVLLIPFAVERMMARRVSKYVNNARNEGVACVASPEQDAASDGGSDMLPLF